MRFVRCSSLVAAAASALAALAPLTAQQAVARQPIAQQPAGARWLDLDGDTARQVTVRKDPAKYLGHPTTVLLPDGATMLCVHPEGHGKGPIVLQRSTDAGRTWSAPLPVPENWATSQETPTIHRLVDRQGTARLVLFSGLHPIRRALSTDDGATWTPLEPIGDFGGIVAMASVLPLRDGSHAAWFHDDGRFFRKDGKRAPFTVYQTISQDGGVTWAAPTVVWTGKDKDLCEPGVIRSPDGARLAMLLRENQRKQNSHLSLSDDEGRTWSEPIPLPLSLTGDRHVGVYAPDGRLFLSFRDMAKDSPTRGDWVAWVGTFDDVVQRRDGQYRVRLSRNWKGTDCAYPGVEALADGTIVATTYGHWDPSQQPYVRSVRLTLAELDARAKGPAPTFARPSDAITPAPRLTEGWQKRMAEDLAKAQKGGYEVVFVGDSITQGWNGAGKEQWASHWEPRKTLNLGVGGDRTQHVLWRLDQGALAALAGPQNAVKACVVMIGTNNSNGSDNTAEEIGAGIAAVVQRLRAGLPQAKVLLLDVFPRGEKPNPQRQKNAAASDLAATAFAGDALVRRLDLAPRFLQADGTLSKETMPDLLHLSPAAYRTWAEAMAPVVDELRR